MWVFNIQIVPPRLNIVNRNLPRLFILFSVIPPLFFKIKLFYADGLCFVIALSSWIWMFKIQTSWSEILSKNNRLVFIEVYGLNTPLGRRTIVGITFSKSLLDSCLSPSQKCPMVRQPLHILVLSSLIINLRINQQSL